MNILTAWTNRMNAIKNKLDHTSVFVERNCLYGSDYFCDGRPNTTKRRNLTDKKPPCKHFKDGKCELKLHLGKKRD